MIKKKQKQQNRIKYYHNYSENLSSFFSTLLESFDNFLFNSQDKIQNYV